MSTPANLSRARMGRLGVILACLAMLAAACASDDRPTLADADQVIAGDDDPNLPDPDPEPTVPDTEVLGETQGAEGEMAIVTDQAPNQAPIITVTGMPAVVNPGNLYSEIGADNIRPDVADDVFRVYVPNEVSGTVTVIDPLTYEIIDTFNAGFIPQHAVPSYDMTRLFVLNSSGNTLLPINPQTGEPGAPIPVEDPYNLYYTPDGSQAVIVAEAFMRLDFRDPNTFALEDSLQTDCSGLNHLDYSIDGRFLIATCEFDGRIIRVDTLTKTVTDSMLLDMSMTGKVDPIKPFSQPQDVRVSPDGSRFYIADLITDGVFVIDAATFTQVDFIQTGVAAHALYPSRDATKLYVVNRGTNYIPAPGSFKGQATGSITVLDFNTGEVLDNWEMPNGGSPDMGNLTPDGGELWLGGRYDAKVYVFDTVTGELTHEIPVGENPHGLTVWPQPGRYSLGHTGNIR